MTAAVAQSPVVEWLRQGGPWGQAPEIVETHTARVFLIGDRAYKLKKAVDLGYLDFSTLERRRAALERELQLNRRTAPNLYLRTLPVTRSPDCHLHLGCHGEIADWWLEMRRFASDPLLRDRAARGQLRDALMQWLS